MFDDPFKRALFQGNSFSATAYNWYLIGSWIIIKIYLMGNQSLYRIKESLSVNQMQVRRALEELVKRETQSPLLLPYGGVFVCRKEVKLLAEYNRTTFLRELGESLEQATLAHPTYRVDPMLIQGACDFMSIVAASPESAFHERADFLVEKIGRALVRTDLLMVGRYIKGQGAPDIYIEKQSIFGFCLVIGAIDRRNFTNNEDQIVNAMLSREQIAHNGKGQQKRNQPSNEKDEPPREKEDPPRDREQPSKQKEEPAENKEKPQEKNGGKLAEGKAQPPSQKEEPPVVDDKPAENANRPSAPIPTNPFFPIIMGPGPIIIGHQVGGGGPSPLEMANAATFGLAGQLGKVFGGNR